LICNATIYTGIFYPYSSLLYLSCSPPFLFGPVLILYIHLMQGKAYTYKHIHLFHLFPFILIVLYSLYAASLDKQTNIQIYKRLIGGKDLIMSFFMLSQLIHFMLYLLISIGKLKTY